MKRYVFAVHVTERIIELFFCKDDGGDFHFGN